MNIKSLLSITILVGLTACNPMKEIYDGLDAQDRPIVKTTDYTLNKGDYSLLAKTYVSMGLKAFSGDSEAMKAEKSKLEKEASSLSKYQYFNPKVTSKDLVPVLLKNNYAEWGKGSSIMVTYNEKLDKSDKVQALYGIQLLKLKADELSNVGINDVMNLSKDNKSSLITLAQSKDDEHSLLIIGSDTNGQSNSWTLVDGKLEPKGYYALNKSDFTSMGLRYPNFSGSASPEDFLPTFLKIKMPYAKDGDSYVTVYEYYPGKGKPSTAEFKEFTLHDGGWESTPYYQTVSSQFIQNGKGWVFDPTIYMTLSASEFVELYNWVKTNKPNYIAAKYGENTEFWFGGSSYYKNFNFDPSATVGEKTEEAGLEGKDLLKAKSNRVLDGLYLLLDKAYPNAPAQVDGIDQYYVIKFTIRLESNNTDYVVKIKGLGNGKFEFAESTPNLPGM